MITNMVATIIPNEMHFMYNLRNDVCDKVWLIWLNASLL